MPTRGTAPIPEDTTTPTPVVKAECTNGACYAIYTAETTETDSGSGMSTAAAIAAGVGVAVVGGAGAAAYYTNTWPFGARGSFAEGLL